MSDELTEKIISAAIEVHHILGPGFSLRCIRYERQVEVEVRYKVRVCKDRD